MPVIAIWENRRSCFANRSDSVSGWLGKLDRGPSSLAARPPSWPAGMPALNSNADFSDADWEENISHNDCHLFRTLRR